MMTEIFCRDNFFTDHDIKYINQVIAAKEPGQDARHSYGRFPNQLLANYINLINDSEFINWMTNRIQIIFDRDIQIQTAIRVKLYLPWDIHSDFFLDQCSTGYCPYYNCLIPLDNVPSQTIIFNQTTSGSNDFYRYKETASKVDSPISQEFWDQHLDFCWPEDRLYLTLKQLMPYQSIGQIQGFPRQYFHSSDNFHTRVKDSKSFIQLRIDCKHDSS